MTPKICKLPLFCFFVLFFAFVSKLDTDSGLTIYSFQPWENVKHLTALRDYCAQPAVQAELGEGFFVEEVVDDE